MQNKAVELLLSKGFAVFPVHGIRPDGTCTCGANHAGDKNAGKHPATPNGLKNATKDVAQYAALVAGRSNLNYAIATGEASGCFVLDVDGTTGAASLEALERKHGKLPDTLTTYTGRGRHMFFAYPACKVHTRAGKLADGLDVRGDGGYVVAPPSKHYSGALYQFIDDTADIQPAPQWLVDMVCADHKRAVEPLPITPSDALPDFTTDDVREMLSYLDADMGHDDWVAVGMALHNGGYGVEIWDEWSRRGQKYEAWAIAPKWRSFKQNGGVGFGTLVYMAEKAGWSPNTIEVIPIEQHPARAWLEKMQAQIEAEERGIEPEPIIQAEQLFDPLSLPSLVGETVRAIVATSQKAQPNLALMNTLAAFGCIFGRRYRSPTNIRTNLYTIGIADTAAGKDHSRKFIKDLMARAGFGDWIGGDTVVSGPGILTALQKHISHIMHLDEIGMLLKVMGEEKAATAQKLASKVITELYSSSGSSYVPGQYADAKVEAKRLINPILCIYGTTTGAKYAESISRSAIASGEINRFIVIEGDQRPERRRFMGIPLASEALVEAWAAHKGKGIAAMNTQEATPEPITVSMQGLEDRFFDMQVASDERIYNGGEFGALWGRYAENCVKIAMIFAIARDALVPRMTHQDLDIAEAIVSQSVQYMLAFAQNNLADSEHERALNKVLDVVRAAGTIKQSDLVRATRFLKPSERKEVLETLEGMGAVVRLVQKTQTKPLTLYQFVQ